MTGIVMLRALISFTVWDLENFKCFVLVGQTVRPKVKYDQATPRGGKKKADEEDELD